MSAKDQSFFDTIRLIGGSPVAFRVRFARISGSALAGLFLSQVVYWSERTSDPQGWFYKEHEDWEVELFISRRELETVRLELLSLDLIEYGVWGSPPKCHYRLKRQRLLELLRGLSHPTPRLPCQKNPRKSAKALRRNRAEANGGFAQNIIHTENTAKTTTEITSEITQPSVVKKLGTLSQETHRVLEQIQDLHPRPAFGKHNQDAITAAIHFEMNRVGCDEKSAVDYLLARTRTYAEMTQSWPDDSRRFIVGSTRFFKDQIYRHPDDCWRPKGDKTNEQRNADSIRRISSRVLGTDTA